MQSDDGGKEEAGKFLQDVPESVRENLQRRKDGGQSESLREESVN